MIARKNKIQSIDDRMKEFEMKIRRSLELQEKLKNNKEMESFEPVNKMASSVIIPVEEIKIREMEQV